MSPAANDDATVVLPSLLRLRWTWRLVEDARLPTYRASLFRSALGAAAPELDRRRARPPDSGLAAALFERPAVAPAVLDADDGPDRVAAGTPLHGVMVLFAHHLPYVDDLAAALELAPRLGFARARARGHLEQLAVEDRRRGLWVPAEPGSLADFADPPTLPPPPTGTLRLRLETPLRLKNKDEDLEPADLDAVILERAVRRRWNILTGATLPHASGPAFALGATALEAVERSRYSAKQGRTMKPKGMVGQVELELVDPAPWPALWLARWAHLGRSTSLGCGRVRLVGMAGGPLP